MKLEGKTGLQVTSLLKGVSPNAYVYISLSIQYCQILV